MVGKEEVCGLTPGEAPRSDFLDLGLSAMGLQRLHLDLCEMTSRDMQRKLGEPERLGKRWPWAQPLSDYVVLYPSMIIDPAVWSRYCHIIGSELSGHLTLLTDRGTLSP
ncbi:hypothetical protein XANCAGTX0491_000184 [Xanthoria calcicola]